MRRLQHHGRDEPRASIFSAWDLFHPLEDGQEFELYHIASPRMTTPEYHSHDFYEIYWFISGDASAYVEEYAYSLAPGDVVIFPPGYMHRAVHHNPEAFYERMFLYIPRDVLRGMGNRDYALVDVLDACAARAQFRFALSAERFEHCRYAVHEIIRDALDNAQPCQSLINRCRVNLLLTLLCSWFEELKGEPGALPTGRIGSVISYINEHIAEDLSLDTLSSHFYISKYHLMRLFKSYTDRSIYRFILAKRVTLAKLMLQSGASPSEAALRCGFGDYSSFYKAFRKETGLSPNRYLACLRAGERRVMV